MVYSRVKINCRHNPSERPGRNPIRQRKQKLSRISSRSWSRWVLVLVPNDIRDEENIELWAPWGGIPQPRTCHWENARQPSTNLERGTARVVVSTGRVQHFMARGMDAQGAEEIGQLILMQHFVKHKRDLNRFLCSMCGQRRNDCSIGVIDYVCWYMGGQRILNHS